MVLIGGIFILGVGIAALVASQSPTFGIVAISAGAIMLFSWYRGKRKEYQAYVQSRSAQTIGNKKDYPADEMLGTFRLAFSSANRVSVRDDFPTPNIDTVYLAAFPFMFSAKMLNNFPPPSGETALQRAIQRLPEVDESNIDAHFSFLGMCSTEPLEIVPSSEPARWTYEAQYIRRGSGFSVVAQIAKGNEDHLHRAAIDSTFEWFARKWGIGGTLMCPFAKELFTRIRQNGIENLSENYASALQIGWELYATVSQAKQAGDQPT